MYKKTLSDCAAIIIALLPFACIVNTLFVPHAIVGGGLTGICEIIFFVSDGLVPIWLSTLVINAILLTIAVLTVGWEFCLKTIVGAAALTLWYKLIPIPPQPLIANPLLAAVLGGGLFGICLAVVMLHNGSSGGTDIIAMIVHHYKPQLSLGKIMVICDIIIILSAYFLPLPHKIMRVIYGLALTISYTTSLDFTIKYVHRTVH